MAEKRKANRNEEAARLALEAHRAKKKRIANAKASAERRAMMRQLNTRGTMMGVPGMRQMREQQVEGMYQRMVGQVMRQAAYTPTDFKQLGKIVKARADRRWSDVERLIKEWQNMVKRRVCRLKKKNMQNIARGLNINSAGGKKKRAQICQEIKNKI